MTGGLPSQWEPEAELASPVPADSAGRGRGFPGHCALLAPAGGRGRRLPKARAGEGGREGWSPGVGCCILGSGTHAGFGPKFCVGYCGILSSRSCPQGWERFIHLFRPKGRGDRGDCNLGLGDLWGPWLQLSQVLKFLEAAAYIHRRGGAVNCPGPNLSQCLQPKDWQ